LVEYFLVNEVKLNNSIEMITVQRKYKVIKASSAKELSDIVNDSIQKEYKDTEGFIFRSSARWQCLGAPFVEKEFWHQALVFIQEEEE
jgi:hypothetical protein